MDYISREAAYPIAKKVVDAITNGEYHAGVFAYDIMDWIDDIPAADVAPVVHGEWEKDDAGCGVCSVCNKYAFETSTHHISGWFPRYCPNCGASMLDIADKNKDLSATMNITEG